MMKQKFLELKVDTSGKKLVDISAKYLVRDRPKYPTKEPSKGKNNIAYSI